MLLLIILLLLLLRLAQVLVQQYCNNKLLLSLFSANLVFIPEQRQAAEAVASLGQEGPGRSRSKRLHMWV